MTAQGKVTTMTSREFNQRTGEAKAAADQGPVIITDRGRPAYVLSRYEDFVRSHAAPRVVSLTALEAFADPRYSPDEPDLMDFIPKREVDPLRPFHV